MTGGAADETSEQEALEAAVAKKWIKNGAADQASIPLGEFCALCVNAVGLKGGVFCSLSKNSSRYSFKELKALGLLDKSADPAMKIDGQNALNLFSACVQEAEAAR